MEDEARTLVKRQQCIETSKNSKGSYLVFLLASSFNVLGHLFPAQTHAAASILFDLADGSPQLRGVSFESLHLQLTHNGSLRSSQSSGMKEGAKSSAHLLRLLPLPGFALLQLGQPRPVLLQEVVYIAFLCDLIMQAAQHREPQGVPRDATQRTTRDTPRGVTFRKLL